MRIGICDDDEQARAMVSDWLKTHEEVLERNIFVFTSGEAMLDFLRSNVLDVIFLDCKMEGMDGIETAKAIRKLDSRVVIILLTDFTDYARFGYGAGVFEYILKKDFNLKIAGVFEKAMRRIMDNSVKIFSVKTSSGLVHLDISEILYIESHRRKKELFMRNGQAYEFYGSFSDIEGELKKNGFIRPHGSFLVNSNYVRVFTQNDIFLSGIDKPVPVSRNRYRKAYDDMTVYAAEVRR